jgi:uncharacterized membrane protein YkvA (DUF1232 family)
MRIQQKSYAAELDRHLAIRAELVSVVLDALKDDRLTAEQRGPVIAAAKYEVEDLDLIPDDVPIYGVLDDLFVSAIALQEMMSAGGPSGERIAQRRLSTGETLQERIARMQEYVFGFWNYCKSACEPFVKQATEYYVQNPGEMKPLADRLGKRLEELLSSPYVAGKIQEADAAQFVAQFRKMN